MLWLSGELNLKSQSLFLLQIFYWVLLIFHFVSYFIQVLIFLWGFFIHIFHWAHRLQIIKSNILIKSSFNYCRGGKATLEQDGVCKNVYIEPHHQVKTVVFGPTNMWQKGCQLCLGDLGFSSRYVIHALMSLDKAFAVLASQSLREGSQERRLLGFACIVIGPILKGCHDMIQSTFIIHGFHMCIHLFAENVFVKPKSILVSSRNMCRMTKTLSHPCACCQLRSSEVTLCLLMAALLLGTEPFFGTLSATFFTFLLSAGDFAV